MDNLIFLVKESEFVGNKRVSASNLMEECADRDSNPGLGVGNA